MRGTNIFKGEKDLVEKGAYFPSKKFGWIIARPIGYESFWYTLKCAWKVLTHKADIVIWESEENNY